MIIEERYERHIINSDDGYSSRDDDAVEASDDDTAVVERHGVVQLKIDHSIRRRVLTSRTMGLFAPVPTSTRFCLLAASGGPADQVSPP